MLNLHVLNICLSAQYYYFLSTVQHYSGANLKYISVYLLTVYFLNWLDLILSQTWKFKAVYFFEIGVSVKYLSINSILLVLPVQTYSNNFSFLLNKIKQTPKHAGHKQLMITLGQKYLSNSIIKLAVIYLRN